MFKNCPKCHTVKSINEFCQNKNSTQYTQCKDCRILTNRASSQRRTAEQRIHRNKFTQERRDFIYATNPSNYEDWEHSLNKYPWEFPEHLKTFNQYLIFNNLLNTAIFKYCIKLFKIPQNDGDVLLP